MRVTFERWAIRLPWVLMAIAYVAVMVGCKMAEVVQPDYSGPYLSYSPSQQASRVEFGEAEFLRQMECVGTPMSRIRESSLPLKVTVYLGGFVCGNIMAAGCLEGNKIGVGDPWFEPALSHELIHFFSMKNGGPPDYAHEGAVWEKCDRLNR